MHNRLFSLGASRIASLGLALLLGACGGGGNVDQQVDSAEGASTPVTLDTRVVSSQGVTLSIDGASLALGAGALATGTPVTLERRAADPPSGELLRLRLSPAGQRLATAGALTIDLPGAPADTQAFWLVDGDPLLAASTRVGDRFNLTLSTLGLGADRQSVPLAAGQKRRLADGGDAGAELSMRVVSCRAKVEALRTRLAGLPTADAMAEAELIGDALRDAVQTCGELEVQQLHQSACTALHAAAENVFVPTSMTEYASQIRRLLAAEASVQRAGADCVPDHDVAALIDERTAIYLPVLAGQVRRGEFASEPGLRELQSVFAIETACQRLGLEAACSQLRDKVFPDLLDAMRRSAFDDCRDRGAALSVAQFLDLGAATGRDGRFLDLARFGMSEVEADLVQCTAPTLAVRVFETVDGSPVALTDRDVQVRPLQGFNDYRLSGTVRPPRRGQIVLEGPVKVARCPDGSAPAADLVVRTAGNGREVARRPHDGQRFTLDRVPVDLSVPDLLTAAALNPDTATGVSLLVRQEGAPCASAAVAGQAVLDQPIMLFQLDLGLAPANQASRWSGTVTVSTEVTATLRGARVDVPSVFRLSQVRDTTTEVVDLSMRYGHTLSLATATELLPGGRITLDAVAPAAFIGQGTASVDSTLVLTAGGCVLSSADRSKTVILNDSLRAGGVLALIGNGQLRITADGLRGAYRVTGQGDQSASNTGCFDPRNFAASFGPETVGGDDFVQFASASATTTVPEGSTSIAGSAVVGGDLLTSTAQCNGFLRKHLGRLQTRLLPAEHVVSCRQRSVLTWQLQRE